MQIAYDDLKNKIHISKTLKNENYFCPACGEKLIIKKGNIRIHHFSHKSNTSCNDEWHYDMSKWHISWQSQFPTENQEVYLLNDKGNHRADVLINNTIIEFQHSNLREDEFKKRNEFYVSLGYKVIWIIDVIKDLQNGLIENLEGSYEKFKWKNPRNYLNDFNYKNDDIKVYLQFDENTWDLNKNFTNIVEETYGILHKIDWKPKETIKNFASNNEISDVEFLNLFLNNKIYIKEKNQNNNKINKNEFTVDDIQDEIYIKNYNEFYGYCPQAKDNVINHKNCHDCNYLSKSHDGCVARFAKYLDSIDRVLDIKKDCDGRIVKLRVVIDGKIKSYKSFEIPMNSGTIIGLWNLHNIQHVANFINLENGKKVQVSQNPNVMYRKYKKIYGKICSENGCYNDFSKNSVEVFYFNKPIWILEWYK